MNMSKDDAYVKRITELRDEELAARTLYATAIALYLETLQRLPQGELPLEGSFGKRIATILPIISPNQQRRTHSGECVSNDPR